MAAGLLGLGLGTALSVSPNRLAPGVPLGAAAALGLPAAGLAAVLLLAGAWRARWAAWAGLLAALVILGAAGLGAARLLEGQATAARASPGGGAWLALGAALLLAREGARALSPRLRLAWVALALAGPLFLAAADTLDALSPVMEFRARRPEFAAAVGEHLALATSALALGLLVALPAAWPGRAGAAADAIFAAVQVVPAIALFGLLVPLLAAVLAWWPALRAAGIGAIGATPAVLAVALYLALPLARAVRAAREGADPAVVEAARAMGFGAGRLLLQVRLPLGLPFLAAGLRTAAVQAVGLTTLAGLVGAGGLGALVFDGMGQFAPDLILLGALPVVALAVTLDAALGVVERRAVGRPA